MKKQILSGPCKRSHTNFCFSLRAGTSISGLTGKTVVLSPAITVDFIFNGQKRRYKK